MRRPHHILAFVIFAGVYRDMAWKKNNVTWLMRLIWFQKTGVRVDFFQS
jgi:hypothetical protein